MTHAQKVVTLAALGIAMALNAAMAPAQQTYPSKTIRILTSTAGGPYDIAMRGLSVPLGQALVEKFVMGPGFEPVPPSGGSPEEFAKFIRSDQEAYARAVKIVGIKAE